MRCTPQHGCPGPLCPALVWGPAWGLHPAWGLRPAGRWQLRALGGSGGGLCGQPRPALSQRLSVETLASSWAGVRVQGQVTGGSLQGPDREQASRVWESDLCPGQTPIVALCPCCGCQAPCRHLPLLSQPLLPGCGWLCDMNPCFKCSMAAPPTRPISEPVDPGEESGNHRGGVQLPRPSVPAGALTVTRCPVRRHLPIMRELVHAFNHLKLIFPRESM